MPLFRCSKCGCVENTAVSNYWTTRYSIKPKRRKNTAGIDLEMEYINVELPLLCSECDPEIGKWHGQFKKESAVGYLIGEDGFLYKKEYAKDVHHTKMISVVTESGIEPV